MQSHLYLLGDILDNPSALLDLDRGALLLGDLPRHISALGHRFVLTLLTLKHFLNGPKPQTIYL